MHRAMPAEEDVMAPDDWRVRLATYLAALSLSIAVWVVLVYLLVIWI
jgi:hypothetical protein